MSIRSHRARLLTVALVAAVGSPALFAGFFLDDHELLVKSDRLSWQAIPEFWSHGSKQFMATTEADRASPFDTFRALTLSTFVVDRQLFGRGPFGYHLTSWLLHLGVCWLTFGWLARTAGPRTAVWGTLLIGFHPLTAEAWVWINGRSDLLLGLLVLSMLVLLDKGRPIAGAVAGLLACFAKEPGLVALGLAAVRPRWPSEPSDEPALRLREPRALAALAVALVAYLAVRMAALGGLRMGSGGQVGAQVGLAAPLLADGVFSLVLPRHTAIRALDEDYAALSPLAIVVSTVLVLALAAYALIALRRRPALSWAMAGFAALMLPSALALTFGYGRYLYLPLLVLLPGVMGLAQDGCKAALERARTPRFSRLLQALGVAYVAALAVGLLVVIKTFRSEITVWEAAASEYPDRSHGWGGIGLELSRMGHHQRAKENLERALSLSPGNPRWLDGLAVSTFFLGEYRRCAELNLLGQRLVPDKPKFYFGRALCLRAAGNLEGARDEVERGLRVSPTDANLLRLRREIAEAPPRRRAAPP